MAKLEKVEEKKFVRSAKRMWDAEVIKLQTLGPYGTVGRNDRLVVLPLNTFLCFEFKREGEKPAKIQLYYRRKFKRFEVPYYVVYTARKALAICSKALRAKEASRKLHRVRTQ